MSVLQRVSSLTPEARQRLQKTRTSVSVCHCRRSWFTGLPFMQTLRHSQHWSIFWLFYSLSLSFQKISMKDTKWFWMGMVRWPSGSPAGWILPKVQVVFTLDPWAENVTGKMWGICFPFMLLLGRAFPDTSRPTCNCNAGTKATSLFPTTYSLPQVLCMEIDICWEPQMDKQM